MDYKKIIDTFYPVGQNDALRDILLVHSKGVADLSMEIIDRHPELQIDRGFVYSAAMLHDIGIVRCNAPGIQCFGTQPYICHGILGAKMLQEYAASRQSSISSGEPVESMVGESVESTDYQSSILKYQRVCSRHTGAGLTKEEIIRQNLPLPHQDLLPETMEEKLICYADKFYSKTHPERRKTLDQAKASMQKFGDDSYNRFLQLHSLFE